MTKYFLLLFFMLWYVPSFSQNYTITGYIKDKESGESLIGANIYTPTTFKGTTSNSFGYFSLTIPSDSITLVVSYVGYQKSIININLNENKEIDVELSSFELDEVVVYAEETVEQNTTMSTINVPIEQIKALPAIFGEVDVLKTIQLLPGVQSGVEGTAGIYVRGGGPDQNLILLDGVPVYNASHLFGAFSVFNADAINNIDLIKGGFPARYGGRLSSVLDISMKEGNKEKINVSGSVGLISSKLTIDGPIKNDKTTFLLSGRRTYLDLLSRPISRIASEGAGSVGYFFYDFNFKINHRFSNSDRLYFSAYTGKDKASSKFDENYTNGQGTRYKNETSAGLEWGNVITALRWNHVFNPKLFSNTTLTYSRYQFSLFGDIIDEVKGNGIDERNEINFNYFSGIYDVGGKIDFEYIPNPNHFIRFGYNVTPHTFRPGVFVFESTYEGDTTLGTRNLNALENLVYIEDDIRLSSNLKANIGVHASSFYVENQFYHSIQPRIALRYLIGTSLSLKASYAEMAQFIHLLTNNGIGLPTDLWVPSTKLVQPQTSKQYAAGVAKTIGSGYEFTFEGYYKQMEGLIEYKEGASFLNAQDNWDTKVERGMGWSYGVELFIQKKVGRFNGWIGYTLAKTERQFENLNFGQKFPYKYDRRHDLSIVGSYKISDKISISGNWVFGTGNAITLPTRKYEQVNEGTYSWWNQINYYEGRNSFRMKSYHRADIGINFSKEKNWGTRTWAFSIYNFYNRRNPFYIDIGYDSGTDSQQFIQYSLFPIIPSFSYNFTFN